MSRSLYARLVRRFTSPEELQSRREFLKESALISASLLLSNCARLGSGRPSSRGGPRVIVVGAGFAGLSAGYELQCAGYDVQLLEARGRLGGRVLSFNDFPAGRTAEGGGELVGSNHPTWNAYAPRFGLSFLDLSEDSQYDEPILLGGRRLTQVEGEALHGEMTAAYGSMTEDARTIDPDAPWLSPNATLLDQRAASSWLENLGVSPLAKQAIRTELTLNNGVFLENQSYLGNLAQVKGGGLEAYWTESEVYRCRGGNQLLAQALAEALGTDRVHLSEPVASIQVGEDKVTVRTAGGQIREAEEVILAVPPSVWERIDITPALPAELRPQMGISVKYLAEVTSRFWYDAGLSQYAFTDGGAGLTWEATDAQAGPGHFVLTSFSSAAVAEQHRAEEAALRDRSYAAAFEEVFPGFGRSFARSRFMNWPSDPWTRAAYSCPAPGQITSHGPIYARGLGRLHFAGEHTCYKFVGYMEGALNSGVSLARKIALRDGRAGN